MTNTGLKTPHIELMEIGPSADLVVRRTKFASADLMKTACRVPVDAAVYLFTIMKENDYYDNVFFVFLQPKKTKNISHDPFGSKLGRIHMPRQDYQKLQVKRGRALRPEKDGKAKKKTKSA